VGYLLNFGKKGGLQWQRFVLSDLHIRRPDSLELVSSREFH
jgi:hypothetical protein